jgi:hypothetical protein
LASSTIAAVCAAFAGTVRAADIKALTSVAPGASVKGTLPQETRRRPSSATPRTGCQGPRDDRSFDRWISDAAVVVSTAGGPKGEFSEVASNDDGGIGTDSMLV